MTPFGSRRHRGYSLIEVIVGTALLAIVALTITALFVKGRQGVNSGKQMTSALATCQHVAEDLDTISYASLTSSWGVAIASSATRATIEISRNGAGAWQIGLIEGANSNWYPNQGSSPSKGPWPAAYTGEQATTTATTTLPTTQPIAAFITRWTTEMGTLANPRLRIMLTPLYDVDDKSTTSFTGNTASFAGAAIIQMEIALQWTEGGKDMAKNLQRVRYVALTQARTFNEV